MSGPVELPDGAEDLEALFDSIAASSAAPQAAATPAPAVAASGGDAADEVIGRIGRMTRDLHDSLRALGYDKSLESAAAAIPDARDRLSYVATMTERAAERVLTATEAAKPIQEKLGADAAGLAGRWDRLYSRELSIDEFKALAGETRQFLHGVPEQARSTNAQLMEVMMAQDFQDLTGQVIKKITTVVHELEGQLLGLLVENAVPARREEAGKLLNGPVVNAAGRADIVANQQQVDELLGSLGF